MHVNIEGKNLLARLLASENLFIRHKKTKTATFDVIKRILTFPIWKDMGDSLYTMLASHEVGHALYTNRERLSDTAKRIDPKNIEIAAAYINIIEDARIERLIKSMYPGLRSVFYTAYEDLYKRNFFGTNDKNINQRCFIDRANLYFKVGEHVSPKYSDEEKAFLQEIEATQTFQDVVDVTKKIYNWAKENNEHPEPIELPQEVIDELKKLAKEAKKNKKNQDEDEDEEDNSPSLGPTISIPMDDEDADDEDGSGDNEDDEDENDSDEDEGSEEGEDIGDSNSEGKDDEGGDSENGNEGKESKSGVKPSKSGSKKKASSKKGNEGEGDGDSKNSGDTKAKGKQNKAAGSGNQNEKLEPVDPGVAPTPVTQKHFDENVTKLNDEKAEDIVYISTPTPILKNIIVDYKTVHDRIRNHFTDEDLKIAEADFTKFRENNVDKVNYIFTQFEMKKQAEQYKRIRVHKTGSLDTLRLHSYKYEDELFRSISIVTDAKNHGLVFVIDWSGSMSSSMAGTIEQLINLTLFCRKANIPFEVYSLTTGGRKAFQEKPGTLVYAANFSMRNYLSSRMNSIEYFNACVNLFALMPHGKFENGGPTEDHLIGCTPLDEAIVTTIELIKDIKAKTKAQVVNAVFLTDGGANTVSQYIDGTGKRQSMYGKERFVIEDPLTRKHYEFSGNYGEMTPRMLEILRDRENIHAVGFYVTSHFQSFFFGNQPDQNKLQKQFGQDGYVISTSWGFDELYILKGGDNLKVKTTAVMTDMKKDPGDSGYVDEALDKLSAFSRSTTKQRLMLDRFVKMIA